MADTQGPRGLQGPQGVQGPIGTQGLQGTLGPRGVQGTAGPQGPSIDDGVIANLFPGVDIGAKINAAIASLGGKAGTVYTLPSSTTYAVFTQVILEAGVRLVLGAATYDCTHTGSTNADLPVFLLKDNTCIESAVKWGAVLIEPVTVTNVCITIADYSRAVAGSPAGNNRITVRGVYFKGRTGNVHTGVTACVHFGNCFDITVEDCRFELVAGYAANMGGAPDTGFYGKGFMFRNNTMLDVYAQNVAAVNAVGIFIQDNYMRRETGNEAQTFIDLETNVNTDKGHLFVISGNVIDAGGGTSFTGSAGIGILGGKAPANPANTTRGIIANNVINGAKDGTTDWYLASGIILQLAQNVIVHGNTITKCGQGGIQLVASQDCAIFGNDLNECGGQPPPGGNESPIGLFGSMYCQITENRIRNYTSATANSPSILEVATVYYGTSSDYNIIAGNALYQRAASGSPALGIIINIATTGANTRCGNNWINGFPVDEPMIATVAELRTVPYPGTRHASKPPFVRLAGQTTFNDGLGGAWYFDFASTTADNGTTVIAPAYFPTAITAGRWRKLN